MTASARKAKDIRLRKIYKKTIEDFDKLLESQDGRCAICLRPFPPLKNADGKSFTPNWDHYHGCCPRRIKEFCGKCCRGLLCFVCNKFVMGIIEKQKIPVDRLVAYFKKWEPILRELGAYDIKPYQPAKKKSKRRVRKKQKSV